MCLKSQKEFILYGVFSIYMSKTAEWSNHQSGLNIYDSYKNCILKPNSSNIMWLCYLRSDCAGKNLIIAASVFLGVTVIG